MGKARLQIEYLPVGKLKPYSKNARVHDEDDIEALAESIEDFDFSDPIGVWGPENLIVEGHGRLMAAKKMGLKEVPVIRLDHLNEEQQRAYRLAHNKTAELSFWDKKLVKEELKGIGSIDMAAFKFELPEILAPEEQEEKEDPQDQDGYYGDERERTYDAYNLHDFDPKRAAGFYELPIQRRCDYIPESLIGFNYMLTAKNREAGIHFFIDDYQFERLWGNPHQYVEKLKEFPCVLTPDFSLYMDMPLAMKIWNTYRSRLIGQVMTDAGDEKAGISRGRWMGAFRDAKPVNVSAASERGVLNNIEKQMSSYGNGARGVIQIFYKGGGGHVFNVEFNAGKVQYIEAQSGRIKDFGETLKHVRTERVALVRTDNLRFSERAKNFVTKTTRK